MLLGSTSDTRYLPEWTLGEYLDLVQARFPRLYADLWFDRDGAAEAIAALSRSCNEFETDRDGRGGSYRRAQQNLTVRLPGVRRLLRLLAREPGGPLAGQGWRALDVLGGDGLVARLLRRIAPAAAAGLVTSDVAGNMVAGALAHGLPAVRQDARFLFLRDRSMDAVLLAYGTHHIPPADRLGVCVEAARVLRPRGRLVVHDFEEGSPAARWFSEVVHRYSPTGHRYHHFTQAELADYLHIAGFRLLTVRRMYDPFVLHAATERQARARLADYLLDMYGLAGLRTPGMSQDELREEVWRLAQRHFRYAGVGPGVPAWLAPWRREPTVYRTGRGWVADVPRLALVAVGEKVATD